MCLQTAVLWFLNQVDRATPDDFAAFWASAVAAEAGLDPYDPASLEFIAQRHALPPYTGR
jgi:hypothetical protein